MATVGSPLERLVVCSWAADVADTDAALVAGQGHASSPARYLLARQNRNAERRLLAAALAADCAQRVRPFMAKDRLGFDARNGESALTYNPSFVDKGSDPNSSHWIAAEKIIKLRNWDAASHT